MTDSTKNLHLSLLISWLEIVKCREVLSPEIVALAEVESAKMARELFPTNEKDVK